MDNEQEEWRTVTGFEDYEVSSLGRVRSYRRATKEKYLSPGGARYRHVVLFDHEGVACTRQVHVLVAREFIGPRPGTAVLNHKNCDRDDNRPTNLEYISHLENIRHAARNGRGVGRPRTPAVSR
jgi:HNH endonuclease/NUMOD4 motif